MKCCSWNLWRRQCFYLESASLPSRPPFTTLLPQPMLPQPPPTLQQVVNYSLKGKPEGVPKKGLGWESGPWGPGRILPVMSCGNFGKGLNFSEPPFVNDQTNTAALTVGDSAAVLTSQHILYRNTHTHTRAHAHTHNHSLASIILTLLIVIQLSVWR